MSELSFVPVSDVTVTVAHEGRNHNGIKVAAPGGARGHLPLALRRARAGY